MPSSLRAGLAALLLLGSTARAQTSSITLTFPGTTSTTTQNLGPGTCTNLIVVNWATTGLTSANICNSLQIWITNGTSCAASPGTGGTDGGTDLILGSFPLSTVFSGTTAGVAVSSIPGLAGQDCSTAITDVTNAICASVTIKSTVDGTCSATPTSATNLLVRYDTQPPDPPSITATAQDSKIIVGLTATGSQAADVLNYQVEYAEQPTDGGTPIFQSAGGEFAATLGRITISNLINDQTYLVRGYALDEVDNRSLASTVAEATPLASAGFWATYKNDGGAELGGCSAGGAAVPSAVAAMAALVALLRRRR